MSNCNKVAFYHRYHTGRFVAADSDRIANLAHWYAMRIQVPKERWLNVDVRDFRLPKGESCSIGFYSVYNNYEDPTGHFHKAQHRVFLRSDEAYALMEWQGYIDSSQATIILSPPNVPFDMFGRPTVSSLLLEAMKIIIASNGAEWNGEVLQIAMRDFLGDNDWVNFTIHQASMLLCELRDLKLVKVTNPQLGYVTANITVEDFANVFGIKTEDKTAS